MNSSSTRPPPPPEWIEVWVPLVGSGTREDPFRPDIPEKTPYRSRCGIESDLDKQAESYGKPLHNVACIEVPSAFAMKLPHRIEARSVAPDARALVACCQIRRAIGLTGLAEEQEIERVLRNPALKGMPRPKRQALLLQLVRRGLRASAAGEIDERAERDHGRSA